MDNRAIGVFDSGLGGLTAVKELHRLLPNEDIIYLGDTGRVPYGSRSRETIIKYAQQDIDFLLTKDIKLVLAACGTVSSTLPKEISSKLPVPYADIVQPAAQQACALTSGGRIGVVGTNATLRSNAFGKAIRSIRADVRVFGNPCPLLYDIFNRLLGYQVTLIDPGRCAAGYVQRYLMQHDLLADRQREGVTEYNVTDETDSFGKTASIFLGQEVAGTVNRVELVE